jgi:hypothetical protein
MELDERKEHENIIKDASLGALTAVIFQVEVFWDVTPCSVVVGYQRFGSTMLPPSSVT